MPQLKLLLAPLPTPMAIVYGINISTPYSTNQINECTRKANVTPTGFNSNCYSYLMCHMCGGVGIEVWWGVTGE